MGSNKVNALGPPSHIFREGEGGFTLFEPSYHVGVGFMAQNTPGG